MTEGRVDVPVDRDGEAVETGPGHVHEHGQPGVQSARAVGPAHSAGLQSVAGAVVPSPDEPPLSDPSAEVQPVVDGADLTSTEAAAAAPLSDPDQVALVSDAARSPVEPSTAATAPPRPDTDQLQSVPDAAPSPAAAAPPRPDTDQLQSVPDAAPSPRDALSGTPSSPDPDEVSSVSGAADPTPDEPSAVAAAPSDPDPAHSAPDAGDPATGEPTAAPAAAPALRDPDEASLRLAEAAVFASASPVTPRALSQILPDDLDPAAVIAALQARYAGRGLELCDVGGGLQFRTAADLAPQLRKVVQVPRRLPRVALETLAIVAYHQPITRPEIEDLRGTGLSQQTLDVLLENDLIVARGRKETPGRPTLWGTTAKFLEYFGLRDIRELPRRQDLLLEAVRPEAQEAPAAASAEDAAAPPAEPPPA